MKKILFPLLLAFCSFAHAQWNAFGTGIGTNDFVIGFAQYQGDLLAYSFPAPIPYAWNGSSTWTYPIAPVPNAGGIHRLLVVDSVMYAATYATGTFNQFYKYENGNWVQMGQNFRNWGSSAWASIYDAIIFQDTLYICGEFARHGSDTINYVAKWADTTWLPVGGGLSKAMQPNANLKYPHQLLEFNNELVVVGNFLMAENDTVNGIAAWDGSHWHGFGSGFDKVAYGACVHNGELYAGGEFTHADGNPVKCIAKWDGAQWVDPGIGVDFNPNPNALHPFVHTLLSHQGRLVVAGGFNKIYNGTTPIIGRGVFVWDGINIDRMNGGVNSDVEALMPYQTGLLIGGDFDLAGGTVACNHVAYYDFITGTLAPLPTEVRVWPTLASTGVHIALGSHATDAGLRMCLLDLQGRVVQAGEVQAFVPMGDLASGMYVIQIWQGDVLLHKQLVSKSGM